MAALPLTPPVFTILRALIEEKTGLYYEAADRELLADKISARAQDAGFESLLDYYYFLRYDDPEGTELRALADLLVVGETYFFREFEQLELVVSGILAPLVASGRRPRVWSAACATGEEPLSLAMLLAERNLLKDVEIVASDISDRALTRARANSYSARSLRVVPRASLVERFLEVEPSRIRVRENLHADIRWERVNLVDRARVAALGTFDVVFCRNVLIYFHDECARGVVDALSSALVPGGSLFVGISESLLRLGSALDCEERGGVFVYRKAG